MKKAFVITFIVVLPVFILAQHNVAIPELRKNKRVISGIEMVISTGILFIDDHGWSHFIKESSLGQTEYVIDEKYNMYLGINLVHKFSSRFDLLLGMGFNNLKYIKGYKTYNPDGTIYHYSPNEQVNQYLCLQILPIFYLGKQSGLYAYIGTVYGDLSKSYEWVGNARINTISGFKSYEISGLTGLGYPLKLFDHFFIGFQGGIRYGFTDMINVNGYRLSRSSIEFTLVVKYQRN